MFSKLGPLAWKGRSLAHGKRLVHLHSGAAICAFNCHNAVQCATLLSLSLSIYIYIVAHNYDAPTRDENPRSCPYKLGNQFIVLYEREKRGQA